MEKYDFIFKKRGNNGIITYLFNNQWRWAILPEAKNFQLFGSQMTG